MLQELAVCVFVCDLPMCSAIINRGCVWACMSDRCSLPVNGDTHHFLRRRKAQVEEDHEADEAASELLNQRQGLVLVSGTCVSPAAVHFEGTPHILLL